MEPTLEIATWTEAMWLTEVNRWVSVVAGVAGVIVVAPKAMSLLIGRVRDWRDSALAMLGRRRTGVIFGSGGGGINFAGSATVKTGMGDWPEGATVEAQLEHIRRVTGHLMNRANTLSGEITKERVARRADVRELRAQATAGFAAVDKKLAASDAQSARFDARGTPLIIAGIVLNGVPDRIAQLPFHLGWIFPAATYVGLLVTIEIVSRSRQQAKES
ncbi:hypothetical protein [Herbidospora mongoliensis]|uniref:hypothetical protein n=1 Tax=Herbidospora mongoliensis TaxID=688067 RepID=UPI00083266F6|nr:hypothetical protein [Herbidospora mongoliensis]